MKYRTSEQRKDKIIQFLEKHPLSTIREISDNYDKKNMNYSTTKQDIGKLLEERKISSLFNKYFVNPSLGQELDLIKKIIKSDKILLPRFRKIAFDNDNGITNVTVAQTVSNTISLFYLKLKIHLFDQSHHSIQKLSWSKKNSISKKFRSSFIEFLKTYSDMDVYYGYLKTLEKDAIKKDSNWKKPTTLQDSLKRFSNFLFFHHYYDSRKFSSLRSGKISIDEEVKRLKKWIVTDSKSSAAKSYGIRNKALSKSLGNISTVDEYQINNAMVRQLAEEGQNASSGKVFSLIFYPVAKYILNLPARKEQNQARRKFKKELGWDIFDLVDPSDFDT